MNTPILEQQTRSNRQLVNVASPDTDSRGVELNLLGLTVEPDLMHDHTRMKYTVPVANLSAVQFNSPKNWEDRTLHWLELDNSNNTSSKTFTFNNDHTFLDDIANTTKTYVVQAGYKLSWYGCLIGGEFFWRLSTESTNP